MAYGHTLQNAHSAASDARATGHVLSGLLAEGLIPDDVAEALALQVGR